MSVVNRTATSEQSWRRKEPTPRRKQINASQTINGAQQKCTRARDTTRKQNNAK